MSEIISGRVLRTTSRFFVGLDLGKERDYTAIAIVEQAVHTLQQRDPVTFAHRTRTDLVLRHAERIPLGTPYPDVVLHVSNMMHNSRLDGSLTLLVDATGLGIPVVDQLRRSRLNCKLEPIVFTKQTKRDLLANLQFLFERDQLQFAYNLKMLDAVLDELSNLRLDDSHTTHDDLAFALALAAWPVRDRTPGGHQQHPLPIYFQDPRKCA
jgi:phage FluMu gp28-like protein